MKSFEDNATKVYVASNGKKVARFVTESGVTVYVDCDIPIEVFEGFRRKLKAKIKRLDREIGISGDSEHIR